MSIENWKHCSFVSLFLPGCFPMWDWCVQTIHSARRRPGTWLRTSGWMGEVTCEHYSPALSKTSQNMTPDLTLVVPKAKSLTSVFLSIPATLGLTTQWSNLTIWFVHQSTGAHLLRGQAERLGAVQPEEKEVSRRCYCTFHNLKGATRDLNGNFLQGPVMRGQGAWP